MNPAYSVLQASPKKIFCDVEDIVTKKIVITNIHVLQMEICATGEKIDNLLRFYSQKTQKISIPYSAKNFPKEFYLGERDLNFLVNPIRLKILSKQGQNLYGGYL
jgi:hypothetical protein